MPLTIFIRLPGGELLLPHLGRHSVGLLLQLLPWGNPRPFGGKRLEQQAGGGSVLPSLQEFNAVLTSGQGASCNPGGTICLTRSAEPAADAK